MFACPKVSTPVLTLTRYAGATIIDNPKFAAEIIATASDNRHMAIK